MGTVNTTPTLERLYKNKKEKRRKKIPAAEIPHDPRSSQFRLESFQEMKHLRGLQKTKFGSTALVQTFEI